MRKNKGKKYALGVMAAWCLTVGAVALTGCQAKKAENKISVESAVPEPETKPDYFRIIRVSVCTGNHAALFCADGYFYSWRSV